MRAAWWRDGALGGATTRWVARRRAWWRDGALGGATTRWVARRRAGWRDDALGGATTRWVARRRANGCARRARGRRDGGAVRTGCGPCRAGSGGNGGDRRVWPGGAVGVALRRSSGRALGGTCRCRCRARAGGRHLLLHGSGRVGAPARGLC